MGSCHSVNVTVKGRHAIPKIDFHFQVQSAKVGSLQQEI